jgi:hypothetical protein
VRARVPGLRRRQALRERLEVAAHNYTQCSQFQTEPTPVQLADAMADIEAAAAKLIAALHLPEAMDEDPLASIPAALRFGALQAQAALEAEQLGGEWSGARLLGDSVRGVYRLHRWAGTYKRGSEQPDTRPAQSDLRATKIGNVYWEEAGLRTARQTPRAKRHAGNKDLDALFGELAGIWIGIFKRRIATSVSGPESANPGEAGGPMVRFFSACLKPILKDKTPNNEAVRLQVRRLFGVRCLPLTRLRRLLPRLFVRRRTPSQRVTRVWPSLPRCMVKSSSEEC